MNQGLNGFPNQLAAPSPYQYSFTTSDFTKTSDTTLSAITGLSATVLTNNSYRITCTLFVPTGLNLGNWQVDFAGGTCAASIVKGVAHYSTNAAGVYANNFITALNTITSASGPANQTSNDITFVIFITVSQAGTLIPRFSQAGSSATTQTVYAGSIMSVEKLN